MRDRGVRCLFGGKKEVCMIYHCEFLLDYSTTSGSLERRKRKSSILDEVKNRDPVPNWREQAGSIGGEEEVPFAVNGPQEV